jgi:hypothetical protein
MADTRVLRFVPSRIEGTSPVAEVAFYPDRLELIRGANVEVVCFADIARWPAPQWLWKFLFSCGFKPRWLPVADRDWFHPPPERYFRFYTDPSLVICMPHDEQPGPYGETYFVRIQEILRAGGFHTNDLG